MATPTLADAIVKVKLVIDQGGTKKDVNKAVNDIKTDLNKEISAYRTIGNRLANISATLLKSIVLPASALGGSGIWKYMQTTEKEASRLRLALGGLRYSWDQFLARIGRVITNSKVLSGVIEKLKGFLDNLDDKKISKLIDKAVWGFALFAVTKILSMIVLAVKELIIMKKELLELAAFSEISKMGGVSGSLRGLGGQKLSPLGRRAIEIRNASGGKMPMGHALSAAEKEIGSAGVAGASSVLVSNFKSMGIAFLKFIPKIAKFAVSLTLWIVMLEAVFRGIGLTSKDLANALSALGTAVKWISYFFTVFVGVLEIGIAAIVEVIKTLAVVFGGEGGSITRLNDQIQTVFKRMEEARPWENKDSKSKDMRFLGQSTSAVSFSGLNATMQSMITLENEMKSRRDNTEAIRENTAAVKAATPVSNGATGSYTNNNPTENYSPFMDKNIVLGY